MSSDTLEKLVLKKYVLDEQACARLARMIQNTNVLLPLTRLQFYNAFQEYDGPMWLFNSMGTHPTAFQNVLELVISTRYMRVDACQTLASVLNTNALPKLQTLCLSDTPIGLSGFLPILQGLELSACGKTLRVLNIMKCNISVRGAEALGQAIRRDVLPSLQELFLNDNRDLGDEGVTYLAQGLQASSQIKLHCLHLSLVGIGDAGLKSLAEAIGSGALLECRVIQADRNTFIHNVSPINSAQRSGGLKNLTSFDFSQNIFEPGAVTVLANSPFEHCPVLESLNLPRVDPGPRQVIKEICDSYGREKAISLKFH